MKSTHFEAGSEPFAWSSVSIANSKQGTYSSTFIWEALRHLSYLAATLQLLISYRDYTFILLSWRFSPSSNFEGQMANRFCGRRRECKIWEIVAWNKLNDLKGEWANYFEREGWNADFLDLVAQNYLLGLLVQGGPSKSVKVVIKARSEVKDREEFSREPGLKCAQNGFLC